MESDEVLKLAYKIKFERSKRNISQEELADLSGVSISTIKTIRATITNKRSAFQSKTNTVFKIWTNTIAGFALSTLFFTSGTTNVFSMAIVSFRTMVKSYMD